MGLDLASHDPASGLLDGSGEQTPTDEVGWKGRAGADDSGYGTDSQDSGAGGGSAGNGGTSRASGRNASAGSGATARVTVDSGRCVGCGACLQVCPAGVFAASGGVVTAQSPDACRLCGRCIRVCRPSAITLNG